MRSLMVALALLTLVAWAEGPVQEGDEMKQVVWEVSSIEEIAGLTVKAVGKPRVVETEVGPAVQFDGVHDGLFLEGNPIAVWPAFTIEALFRADADGGAEARFVHIQEAGTENRAMLETRLPGDGTWYADTFLRTARKEKPLADRAKTHGCGEWHRLALTYDGTTMRQYVDGALEVEGRIPGVVIGAGRVSLGIRQNMVSPFKGAIRRLRFSDRALGAAELM